MSKNLQSAIDELTEKLSKQEAEVIETKQAINFLYKTMGQPGPFSLEGEGSPTSHSIMPDSFYGKPLATAIGDYLEMRAHAVPFADVMDGLNRGGYDFSGARHPERVVRVAVGKNTAKFVVLKASDSVGLKKWYPNAPTASNGQREKLQSVEPSEGEPGEAQPEPGSSEETLAEETIDGKPSSFD